MSFREAMRRVITGDTPEGKSVVVIDGGPSSEIGDVLFKIWGMRRAARPIPAYMRTSGPGSRHRVRPRAMSKCGGSS